MTKNIFKIVLSVFLLTVVFLSFQVKNSYAQALFEVNLTDSNSGTSWGVRTWYYYSGGVMGPNTTYTPGTSSFFFGSSGLIDKTTDKIKWQTACVDPKVPTSTATSTYDGIGKYTMSIDVTCSGNCIGGYPSSCDNPNNHGTVSPGATCPSGPYCMVGGVVSSSSCSTSNPSYCPGAFDGSNSQSCSGTTCVDKIPDPPTGLNATPWCNASASRMTFGWNVSSGATKYNLTWNNPSGSYNNISSSSVCSGSTCSFSPAVDFTDGVLINWSIAACNSSGCSTPATGAKTSQICSSAPPPSTCIPKTCTDLGAACGSISDGCGNTLNCGTCSSALDSCVNNACVSATTCFYCNSTGACDVNFLPAGATCTTNCNNCNSSCTSNYNLNASGPNYTAVSSPYSANGFLLVSTAGKVWFNLSNTCTIVIINSVSAPFSSPGPLLGGCSPLPNFSTLCQVNGNNAPNGSYDAKVTTVDSSVGRSLPLPMKVVSAQELQPCYSGATAGSPVRKGGNVALKWDPIPVQYYDTITGTTKTADANNYCVYVNGSIQGCYDTWSLKDFTDATYTTVSVSIPGTYTFQVYGKYVNFVNSSVTGFTVLGNYPASTFAEAQDVNVTVNPATGAVTCAASTFTVSGNVYIDTNGNGAKDSGETDYSGATVSLSTGASTTSDKNGNYTFSNLSSNTYTVTITIPSGYTATTTNPVSTSVGPSTTVNFGMRLIPTYTISGNVFVDQNKDALQNGSDTNYTGSITISPNPAGATVSYPNPAGNYLISGLTGGTYTISYTSLPTGYQMTNPLNGPPPSFSVTVGPSCSVGGSNSASCDANGNITALRYGITNSVPWIQSTGGDIYLDPFEDTIPKGATCGSYASLNGGGGTGTPGVMYCGGGSCNFGLGEASQNPPYNWMVGGPYPDTYVPTTPGVIRTSYSYMRSLATQSNLTPVDISSYCGGGGIANCTLSSASLPNGLYISNGDLTLTGASYTFPANKNFVILVNGNLNIQTEVHVPIGSTAFFTTSGDISVASSVGEAVITSTRANVEGYYSTDKSFYVQSLDATGRGLNCPTSDKRLNLAGSIVVNAALKGGSFVRQRDLCAGDLQCPVFMVIERPDFVLNSPEFLKSGRRVWQEIAP